MGTDGFSRYPVQDRGKLRGLVAILVNHYGGGSVNAAAPKIGVSQPTLHRLHVGETDKVSQATMQALEEATGKIDRRLQRDLALAIMPSPALRLYLRGYLTWCRERELRLTRRRGQAWARGRGKPPRPVHKAWYRNNVSADLGSTFQQARQEFPEVFERLDRFVRRKGIPPERHKVALVRIIEPLAESSASAFFEPRWIDLTPTQRHQFLTAGVRREEVLMSGEHPQIRANTLAAGKDPVGDKIWADVDARAGRRV